MSHNKQLRFDQKFSKSVLVNKEKFKSKAYLFIDLDGFLVIFQLGSVLRDL